MENFEVFEELFAADFVDHTPQPGGFTADRDGARNLYRALRAAFPDFHAEIHWQISDGDRVTTYKTYHGTHEGTFWGLAPTGRKIHFETVDVMRVRNGKITDHWGRCKSLFSYAATWPSARLESGKERLGISQRRTCLRFSNLEIEPNPNSMIGSFWVGIGIATGTTLATNMGWTNGEKLLRKY